MKKRLSAVVGYLDRELKIDGFEDSSNNGLQVENTGTVTRVCCGVDASMEFFELARDRGADFLVCHHGISWNDSLKRITGINYRRMSFLMENDMALYACHLPLDAHPVHGNNAQICRALGLKSLTGFGTYRGQVIGFAGRLSKPMSYEKFKKRVREVVNKDLQTMDFGKKTVQSVAVVSGGAAQEIVEAGMKGMDVYLSGEPALSAYSQAQEYGINAIFAGHYATEVFGVKAVAALLSKKFGLKTKFVDLQIPY